MRIGDTQQYGANPNIPSDWNNGDRALLRELMEELIQFAGSMMPGSQIPPDQLKQIINEFKSDIDEFKQNLLPKLPPDVQKDVNELFDEVEKALPDILNPKTQMDAAIKIGSDMDDLQMFMRQWM